MRNVLCTTAILAGFVVAMPQALADEWFFGFKLAYFDLDDNQRVDDPDNSGLLIGYDWDVKHGSVGVEAEFTTTFQEGEVAGQDVEVDTGGLYATYRTRGPGRKGIGPYFKLKAGVAYKDLSIGANTEDETNASAGIGVGIDLLAVSFEYEHTTLDDDADIVSLSIRF